MGFGALPISWIRRQNNTQVLVKTGKCITFRPHIHPFFKITSPLERSQAVVSISGLHLSPATMYCTKQRFLHCHATHHASQNTSQIDPTNYPKSSQIWRPDGVPSFLVPKVVPSWSQDLKIVKNRRQNTQNR